VNGTIIGAKLPINLDLSPTNKILFQHNEVIMVRFKGRIPIMVFSGKSGQKK
jgi:hypothetical protein